MKTKTNKEKQLRKLLDEALECSDCEAIHARYDDLLEYKLRQLAPSWLRCLKNKVKGWSFWYA